MAESVILSEPVRIALAQAAIKRAAGQIADEAEALAAQIERGNLPELDGPTALRLFAALARSCKVSNGNPLVTPAGRC